MQDSGKKEQGRDAAATRLTKKRKRNKAKKEKKALMSSIKEKAKKAKKIAANVGDNATDTMLAAS